MQRYKILDKSKSVLGYALRVCTRRGNPITIDVGRNPATDKLQPGNRITVLRDKYLSCEDYVYLYRGGMHMNTRPASLEKYAVKMYIENLPGVFDCGKLDRAKFKIALWHECDRRGIRPHLTAWHNLQNILMHRARNDYVL
ncbi:MAG: hypothetical protein J6T57_00715 [Alphaproteobacteria bacterium]|nr:hypothetical protein [Alphaproteobacteria bacterium]